MSRSLYSWVSSQQDPTVLDSFSTSSSSMLNFHPIVTSYYQTSSFAAGVSSDQSSNLASNLSSDLFLNITRVLPINPRTVLYIGPQAFSAKAHHKTVFVRNDDADDDDNNFGDETLEVMPPHEGGTDFIAGVSDAPSDARSATNDGTSPRIEKSGLPNGAIMTFEYDTEEKTMFNGLTTKIRREQAEALNEQEARKQNHKSSLSQGENPMGEGHDDDIKAKEEIEKERELQAQGLSNGPKIWKAGDTILISRDTNGTEGPLDKVYVCPDESQTGKHGRFMVIDPDTGDIFEAPLNAKVRIKMDPSGSDIEAQKKADELEMKTLIKLEEAILEKAGKKSVERLEEAGKEAEGVDEVGRKAGAEEESGADRNGEESGADRNGAADAIVDNGGQTGEGFDDGGQTGEDFDDQKGSYQQEDGATQEVNDKQSGQTNEGSSKDSKTEVTKTTKGKVASPKKSSSLQLGSVSNYLYGNESQYLYDDVFPSVRNAPFEGWRRNREKDNVNIKGVSFLQLEMSFDMPFERSKRKVTSFLDHHDGESLTSVVNSSKPEPPKWVEVSATKENTKKAQAVFKEKSDPIYTVYRRRTCEKGVPLLKLPFVGEVGLRDRGYRDWHIFDTARGGADRMLPGGSSIKGGGDNYGCPPPKEYQVPGWVSAEVSKSLTELGQEGPSLV